MYHCRSEFVSLLNVCLGIINEKFYEIIVPMISSKMQSSKLLISRLIGPLAQNLLLLIELHVFQIVIKSMVV